MKLNPGFDIRAAGRSTIRRAVRFTLECLEVRNLLSLVAAFNFNEASGSTLTDLSGNGNKGIISGAAWTTSGKYGGALSFNGTNNVVTVNDSATLDLTNGMTIEAWVKPTTTSGTRTILVKERPGGAAYGLYSSTNVTRPSAVVNVGGTDRRATSNTNLSTSVWTHVAATYDGSTLRYYVNGSLKSSVAASGNIVTTGNGLRFGGHSSLGNFFSGLIDDVRVYNNALSQTAIQADMNTPVAATTTPPTNPPANESDNWKVNHPEWIWSDDFESDRSSSYFEYNTNGGTVSRASGTGMNGSTGMKVVFNAGTVDAGGFKLAFGKTPSSYFKPVDAGTASYKELYWRLYLKNQAGWTGGGGDKLSRALVMANSNWAEAAFGHVWSQGNSLAVDPASGTDTAGKLLTKKHNDFANMRWLGLDASDTSIFDSSHVGKWYCIEAHMKLNDPGVSNGVFELWIDGKLEAQRTSLNWLGSYNAYSINTLFIENYWNDGSPKKQERYIDNLVVSTKPIGPLAGASATSSSTKSLDALSTTGSTAAATSLVTTSEHVGINVLDQTSQVANLFRRRAAQEGDASVLAARRQLIRAQRAAFRGAAAQKIQQRRSLFDLSAGAGDSSSVIIP